MSRTHLYFKVELEHEPEDNLEKVGGEISRLIQRVYGVRSVELSNMTTVEE